MHVVRLVDAQETAFDFELAVHRFSEVVDCDPDAAVLLADKQLSYAKNCPPEASLRALEQRYRHEQPLATPHRHELLVARSLPDRSLLGAASLAIGRLPLTRARIVAMHVTDQRHLRGVARTFINNATERARSEGAISIDVEPGRNPDVLAVYENLGFHAISDWQDKHFTLRREL